MKRLLMGIMLVALAASIALAKAPERTDATVVLPGLSMTGKAGRMEAFVLMGSKQLTAATAQEIGDRCVAGKIPQADCRKAQAEYKTAISAWDAVMKAGATDRKAKAATFNASSKRLVDILAKHKKGVK